MATNWTIRDRWHDICRGVAIGAIVACSAIAYSPRLTSALHALGSPRPEMEAAPVAISAPDWLSPADRVQLEDTTALVGSMRLPVTARATGTPPARQRRAPAPARRDQIGELIAANR